MNTNVVQGAGKRRFKGKIDFSWYAIAAITFASTIGLAIAGAIGVIESNSDAMALIVGASIFLLFDIFFIDSCTRNYVDFCESSLEVRVSLFSESIPYSLMSSVKETNSVRTFPLTTSLDRLQIRYGSLDTLIAVKEKEEFFSEIQKRNPHIQIERTEG